MVKEPRIASLQHDWITLLTFFTLKFDLAAFTKSLKNDHLPVLGNEEVS